MVRRFSRLDLPTLDRPMTATSGRPSGGGHSSASSVAFTNSTFCIFLSSTMRISGRGSVWPSAPTRSTGRSHLDANISVERPGRERVNEGIGEVSEGREVREHKKRVASAGAHLAALRPRTTARARCPRWPWGSARFETARASRRLLRILGVQSEGRMPRGSHTRSSPLPPPCSPNQ